MPVCRNVGIPYGCGIFRIFWYDTDMTAEIFDSRVGNLFVIAFALTSIAFAAISFFCSSQTCGLFLVIPILPWAVLLEHQLGISIPWAIYPFLLLLNTVIVYSMGVACEVVYRRIAYRM